LRALAPQPVCGGLKCAVGAVAIKNNGREPGLIAPPDRHDAKDAPRRLDRHHADEATLVAVRPDHQELKRARPEMTRGGDEETRLGENIALDRARTKVAPRRGARLRAIRVDAFDGMRGHHRTSFLARSLGA
jgi:hypothetical protein